MREAASPLGGARFDGAVEVREEPTAGMISLRGDLASDAVAAAVREAAGTAVPSRRGILRGADGSAGWMSPDELLLLCPYPDVGRRLAAIEAALAGERFLAVDMSGARALFSIEGDGVRDVLAKLVPADMAPRSLPPGELRRTRLAQVPAAFWLEEEGAARLVCFRSVAGYAMDVLSAAAAPGSEVGHF